MLDFHRATVASQPGAPAASADTLGLPPELDLIALPTPAVSSTPAAGAPAPRRWIGRGSLLRQMLLRRRADPVVFGAVVAMLAFGGRPAPWLLIVVMGTGLFFAGRRRSWRLAPPAFTAALLAYNAWAIGLVLVRGEPIIGSRTLLYNLVELGFAVFPLGLSFMQRPMTALVIGARFGVFACAALSVASFLLDGGRVGLGMNEAIFACMAALAGVAGRAPVPGLPRIVPNGILAFYLSGVPVALSGTRAAWFIYLAFAAVDAVRLLRSGLLKPGRRRWLIVAAGLALPALAVPASRVVADRVTAAYDEYLRFGAEGGGASTSVGARLALWPAALGVIAAHPAIGVGGERKIAETAAAPGVTPAQGGEMRQYRHLHSLVLDEALTNGLVGLCLLLLVFASFLATVFRGTRRTGVRETAVGVVLLLFSFGSFHGVLLNEWIILFAFTIMSVLMVSLRSRRELAEPAQHLRAAARRG